MATPRFSQVVRINEADPNTVLTANTANYATPILTHTVPLGVERVLRNGTPFRMKLLKSDSTDIDKNSTIFIAYQRPEMRLPKDLFFFKYNVFYSLTLAQQADLKSYGAQLALQAPYPRYVFTQQSKLILLLLSPDVIDTTKCNIEFTLDEYVVAV